MLSKGNQFFFRSCSVLVDICRGRDGGGMEGRRMRRFVLVEVRLEASTGCYPVA